MGLRERRAGSGVRERRGGAGRRSSDAYGRPPACAPLDVRRHQRRDVVLRDDAAACVKQAHGSVVRTVEQPPRARQHAAAGDAEVG